MTSLSIVTPETSRPSAAIVAIGTELTSGQILNRNSQWISDRLTALGIIPVLHEAVPDERALILKAFDHAAEHADLIFVTGGLGPTSDDFTREMIAEWSAVPLHYRDESWQKIVARLTERGIEVAPSNRKQCFFPEGADVLENLEGTADGFRLAVTRGDHEKHLIVLPGPTREINHLWERFIEAWLRERFPSLLPEQLFIWKTLGKSESALGEIVESAVAGFDGVLTGYRASLPYVEVKVWVPRGHGQTEEIRAKVESEIGAYTLTRGNEDLLDLFFTTLREKTGTLGLTFLDLGSSGALTERIIRGLKRSEAEALRPRIEVMTRLHAQSDANELPESASEWLFGIFPDGTAVVIGPQGNWRREIRSPWTSPLLKDRANQFLAEKSLQFYLETLALL